MTSIAGMWQGAALLGMVATVLIAAIYLEGERHRGEAHRHQPHHHPHREAVRLVRGKVAGL
jgi:hypothetical protein